MSISAHLRSIGELLNPMPALYPRPPILVTDLWYCPSKSRLTISTVFENMMTSLGPETSRSNGPRTVLLPENADVVQRIIHGLYAARHKPDILPEPSLELLHADVMFHQKYNIKVSRSDAESALTAALRKNPFAGIAYAGRLDDLTLGRQAIELLRFDPVHKGGVFDLWAAMADIKPSWQLALASLLLPYQSFHHVQANPAFFPILSASQNHDRDQILYRSEGNC